MGGLLTITLSRLRVRSGFDPMGKGTRSWETGPDMNAERAPESPVRPGPDATPYWQWPDLDDDDRLIGGVAAGIGRELGVDAIWVRLAFVVLFAVGGWGAMLYGGAWLVMALSDPRSPLGFSLTRRTRPVEHRVAKGRTARLRIVGLGLIVGGLALLLGQVQGFQAGQVLPIGVIGAGLLVSWQRLIGGSDANWRSPKRWLIIVAGLGMATAAVIVLVSDAAAGLTTAAGSFLVALGAVTAMAVLSAPWWLRLVRERDAERQARVRSDERAEVAAHLHDSVLQTLSLIQRNSGDPQAMLNLARRQERELRNWLDPNRASRSGQSIRGHLDVIASDVEELHGTAVEVVAVGDCLVTPNLEAVLAATREAAVNAAKHSGSDRVDIYLEVGEDEVEVFVRDTGKGFEPELVPEDRQGVRHSIYGRMERVGGSAIVSSSPGGGTEVELRLDREFL